MHCPLDASTRDSIRLDWKREADQHTVLEHEWKRKAQEQAETERGWKRATKQHESDVARRIHEEQLRAARVRAEWTRETERHARESEEVERHERDERERERHEWQREMERHVRNFEEIKRREREEWKRERERWRGEVEEREQREEEERQRHHMYWGHVEGHTCTSYATREYSAQLMNLPRSWKHPLEACKNTPLEIHGISHSPKSCEDKVGGLQKDACKANGVPLGSWCCDW